MLIFGLCFCITLFGTVVLVFSTNIKLVKFRFSAVVTLEEFPLLDLHGEQFRTDTASQFSSSLKSKVKSDEQNNASILFTSWRNRKVCWQWNKATRTRIQQNHQNVPIFLLPKNEYRQLSVYKVQPLSKARKHYQHRWKEIPGLSTIQILKGFPCRASLIVQTPTFRIAVTRATEINKNRKHFVNQASQWIQFDRPIIFMDSFKRHCFSYTSS